MLLGQEGRQAILRAMSEKYASRILLSTIESKKAIEEISQENGMPISTCYKRVHELVNDQLLRIENARVTDEGKKFQTFRSAKSTSISLCWRDLDLRLDPLDAGGYFDLRRSLV